MVSTEKQTLEEFMACMKENNKRNGLGKFKIREMRQFVKDNDCPICTGDRRTRQVSVDTITEWDERRKIPRRSYSSSSPSQSSSPSSPSQSSSPSSPSQTSSSSSPSQSSSPSSPSQSSSPSSPSQSSSSSSPSQSSSASPSTPSTVFPQKLHGDVLSVIGEYLSTEEVLALRSDNKAIADKWLTQFFELPKGTTVEAFKALCEQAQFKMVSLKHVAHQEDIDGYVNCLKNQVGLTHLDLSDCFYLDGEEVAECIQTLPKLKWLSLANTTVAAAPVLASPDSLTKLETLDLSNCTYMVPFLDRIWKLRSLHTLIMKDVFIYDVSIMFPKDCAGINNAMVEGFKKLTQLRHLDLGYFDLGLTARPFGAEGNLKKGGLSFLTGEMNLEKLVIHSEVDLPPIDLASISKLKQLKELELRIEYPRSLSEYIPIKNLGFLHGLSSLTHLCMTKYRFLKDISVFTLDSHPVLAHIDFMQCGKLEILKPLENLESSLTHLALRGCRGIGEKQLYYVAGLTNLVDLDLRNTIGFSATELVRARALTRLDLDLA